MISKKIKKQKFYIKILVILLAISLVTIIFQSINNNEICNEYNDLTDITNKASDLLTHYSGEEFTKLSYMPCKLNFKGKS